MPFLALLWPLLRRFWMPLSLASAVLVIVAQAAHVVRAHDATVRRDAVSRDHRRAADSTIQVWAPHLARASAAIPRDTVAVARYLTRWRTDTAWRTDTLHVAGDTTPRVAIPVATLAAADAGARACTLLRDDCARYRTAAEQTIAALRSQVATLTAAAPSSSAGVPWRRIGAAAVVGLVAGEAHARGWRVRIPLRWPP